MTARGKRALTIVAAMIVSTLGMWGTVAGTAAAAPITEFTRGIGPDPASLTVGPDGKLWFVEPGSIDRITTAGQVTPFTQGLSRGSSPSSIETGGDGNLWFTDVGMTHAIGRITPAGQITEFDAGTSGLNPGAVPTDLTDGPDGTLWFLDNGSPTRAIGEINKTGVITELTYSTDPNDNLNAIAEGPDGNMYVTVQGNNTAIGKVTVATGTVLKIPHGMPSPNNLPNDITDGPDGNIWFDDPNATTVSRLTAGGTTITDFGTGNGLHVGAQPDAMTAGPDGDVWFTDQFSGHDAVAKVTPAGAITESTVTATPWGITPGIDGNLWVPIGDMGGVNAIDRITPAGTISVFSDGLAATANFGDGSDITVGPDGNLWTIDEGVSKAIVRADVQLPPTAVTGAASAVTPSSATVVGTVNPRGNATAAVIDYGPTPALGAKIAAGTLAEANQSSPVSAALTGLPGGATIYYRVEATNAYGMVTGATQTLTTAPAAVVPPPATTSRNVTIGDQAVTVTVGAGRACLARTSSLPVWISATTTAGSHAAHLRFATAELFLDRGVAHVRHTRVHGKRKTITLHVANATVHHLPVKKPLPLRKLMSGSHKLRAALAYARTVKMHGRRQTLTTRKTLTIPFRVC